MAQPAAFDDSNSLDSFWAELEANDLPQPAPQTHRDADAPQQHTVEEEAEEDECEQGHQSRLLMQQEWDGTAEPPLDTLRYTVEWKAVMNTKRIGIDTDEDVFLAPGAYWNNTLHGKIDQALSSEFTLQYR